MGNLTLLSTEKMLALTQVWTVDHRSVLAGAPQTSGLLVSLDAVFARLTEAAKRGPASTSAREIYKTQRNVDQIHDDLLRGNYYLLTALSYYASARLDPGTAQSLANVRDQLYPNGLRGTGLSYEEEAGAAEILEKNLTDDVQSVLKGIAVSDDGNLLEKVHLQIATAKQLRVLEQQKKEAQQNDAASDHADNEERKTRFEWIDTVRALETNLRLARRNKNITEEVENKLLSSLRAAQKEAAQKATEEKKKAGNGPEGNKA